MFSELYGKKLKFDWDTMVVYEYTDNKYVKLDLELYRNPTIARQYSNWKNHLDALAFDYKISKGKDYKDCPVICDGYETGISLTNRYELRVYINMFIFVGIRLGYMFWDESDKFFIKLNNIILMRKWFEKGGM